MFQGNDIKPGDWVKYPHGRRKLIGLVVGSALKEVTIYTGNPVVRTGNLISHGVTTVLAADCEVVAQTNYFPEK